MPWMNTVDLVFSVTVPCWFVCFTQKTNVDLSVNHNSLNIKILSQITTENQRNFWKEREGEIPKPFFFAFSSR